MSGRNGRGGGRPARGGRGGSPSPPRRTMVSVDAEMFATLLSEREQLAESARRYLIASDREIRNLMETNLQLMSQVTALRERIRALSAELRLSRSAGASTSEVTPKKSK